MLNAVKESTSLREFGASAILSNVRRMVGYFDDVLYGQRDLSVVLVLEARRMR